jgi:hypothetical protein
LYGVLIAAISNCLFEWDKDDYQLLMAAKRQELVAAGVHMPTEAVGHNKRRSGSTLPEENERSC